MGTKERREREKLETRDKILDAARDLFIKQGYDGVSMRMLAQSIEYSPTAIYLHFVDKEQLFQELCRQDFARLAQVFQDAEMPTDPVERLMRIGRTYVEFGIRYPNHYKLMFMTARPPAQLNEQDCEGKGNPEVDAYAFLKLTAQQVMDAGCFREELKDADLISQTLWAAVHGVISLQIAKCNDSWVDFRPMEQRAELMLDVTLRGLLREVK